MTAKKFVQSNTQVFVFDFDESQVKDKLTPAIYTVCFNPMQGYYLQRDKEKFDIETKTYGTLSARANRIIKTFKDRSSSTGVLLTGLKGSGKTLLAQTVSNKLLEEGLPVILVESNFSGDAFVDFLNKVGECVLIFDEFAKVFEGEKTDDKNKQDGLLSIFDGNKSLKRLIFVIENYAHRMNEFYINRPGRLFYHFEYDRLEEIVIDEYCADRNISDEIKAQIKSAYYKVRTFSFDILKAIVDEHKRFPEDAISSIVDILNIDTESFYKTILVLDKVVSRKNKNELYECVPSHSTMQMTYNDSLYGEMYVKRKDVQLSENMVDALDKKLVQIEDIQIKNVIFENAEKVVFQGIEYYFEFNKQQKSNFDYRLV